MIKLAGGAKNARVRRSSYSRKFTYIGERQPIGATRMKAKTQTSFDPQPFSS